MVLYKFFRVLFLTGFGLASPIQLNYGPTNFTLQWAPCDLDFPASISEVVKANGVPLFCANLEVPLDYTNPDNGKTLELQLVKIEATTEPFKGSLIMNPGGPGSSGVEEIAKSGPRYSEIMGGHFNVIGFDARATGRTLEFVCKPPQGNSSSLARRITNFTVPQANMYEMLVEKAWQDGKLYADACAETEGLADIASLISTPFVARDILNIVDALKEDGMLRFWGRSYSSVLGQTFAAMFPDRIGRLFLDSILPNDDYYSGQWATANRGTEVSLLNFLHECVNAGPEVCTIANFSGPGTTAQDLHNELGVVFDELLQNPTVRPTEQLKVPLAFWQSGSVTWYQDLKYSILTQLYQPIQFSSLTLTLEAILKRDWTSQYLGPLSLPTGERWGNGAPWNFHGIGCGDSHFRANKPEDMYSLVQVQQVAGSWSDAFAPQVWVCAHWAFEAAEKFDGPFVGINTSYPVLLANGLHDPITPISSAFEVSANLLGSRVLQHNGHGHGVMNHPSNCTVKAIHDYFNDGTLPDVGTKCEPDQTGFEIALAYEELLRNSTVQGN